MLDEYSKALLIRLWGRTVAEIGEARFDEALLRVLESSPFRPDIADIRRAAGLRPTMPDPDAEALEALNHLLGLIRLHGPELAPLPGKLISELDSDGRVLIQPRYAPPRPPEALHGVAEGALVVLGSGEKRRGLALLAAHPGASHETGISAHWQLRDQAEIERRWCVAYTRAREDAK